VDGQSEEFQVRKTLEIPQKSSIKGAEKKFRESSVNDVLGPGENLCLGRSVAF
jgi:hypothetical protein